MYKTIDNNDTLLEDAFRLQAAVQAGLLKGNISSDELEILTVMNRDQPLLEAKIRADLIAASVSKLFASSTD